MIMNIKVAPIIGGIRLLTAAAAASALASQAFGQPAITYTATNKVPYSYVDVSSTGSSVLATVDDGSVTLSLPFGFQFYGATYNSLCVSSNGILTFGGCPTDDATTRDLTAQPLPGHLALIAPFWMDLTFAQNNGSVFYDTVGAAPSRRFVVQWSNTQALNVPDSLNFQVLLQEGTNTVEFQYQNVTSSSTAVNQGAGATVGIAPANSPVQQASYQWSRNQPVLQNNEAILFTPPAIAAAVDVSSNITWTTSAFTYNRSTKLYSGTVTITNSGSAAINYPLTIVLTSLTAGVSAANPTGTLTGQPPYNLAGPYYAVPGSGALAPGQSANVPVAFTDPTAARINFAVKTYSGAF
jgi:hypothetical protein